MEVLGRRVDNFSYPVCSAFQPRLSPNIHQCYPSAPRDVEGQVCYSLDLAKVDGIPPPGQGSFSGDTAQHVLDTHQV